jgi:hypothetical protein
MGIEGSHSHQEDHNLAFERVVADFGSNISALHDLIASRGEIPPDVQVALDALKEKLHTYDPAQ